MLAKIEKALSKFMGGSNNDRELKRLNPIVDEINRIAEEYKELSDDELKAKTNEFRYRLKMGETIDDILPEAFAAVKDTCRRLIGQKWLVRGQEIEWNMVPYDVQLIGGIALHEGKIAEMATGEGKTLVATMPLYLNALEGKGAHLITVNDYLAQRDCEWMGEIYKFLGLSVAAIYGQQEPDERKIAYQADICYGTNNEFGFDYLRDNMTADVWSVVQRRLHYAIVDEVDSVLIDEARTPLIISGSVGAPRNVYNELKPVVENLYKRQQELVVQLIKDGKALLEEDEERAGMAILRALRGDPKNKELLELLTSEFWVKKLIERIQGQFEVNKDMATVDQELYYTIDEKSHVVDITEKGRIFLSGGRDQDVAHKIQKLDALDEVLSNLAGSKQKALYFTLDPVSGRCNGLSFEGMLALNNISGDIGEAETSALDELDKRLRNVPSVASDAGDKSSIYHNYFKLAKKMDKAVNGLGEQGKAYLSKDGDAALTKLVNAFDDVLSAICQQADVDTSAAVPRNEQNRRRQLQNDFFESEKSTGAPIGLTEQGRIAVLAAMFGGDPLTIPIIFQLDVMLRSDESEDKMQDYFEFSDDFGVVKHIAEKGRIALLGGNPDLYVLPDRSIVEERDRQIQQLLDRTVNQTAYDYAERVQAVERLNRDIQSIHKTCENDGKTDLFYTLVQEADGRSRVQLTEIGQAFFTDFAAQTNDLVLQFDKDVRANKNDLSRIFKIENNKIIGLATSELDALLGRSFKETQAKIKQWQVSHSTDSTSSSTSLRLKLDEFLGSNNPTTSPSRAFEDVQRFSHVFENIFRVLARDDVSDSEKRRLLRRYFEFRDDLKGPMDGSFSLPIAGLSDAGIERLAGDAVPRTSIFENLAAMLSDLEMESDSVFEQTENGLPMALQKAARSRLVDGLPFFSYDEGLKKFRDEMLHLSAKKVNSSAELQSLLPKEKAHLRARKFMFDEREMNELIAAAHSPSRVITAEEIDQWFRLQFNRQPSRVLEARRDRLWANYQAVEERIQNISQLLRAYTLYHRDVEYVVKTPEEGELRRHGGNRGQKAVMIVDSFTGRLMPGRRFSDGLHEALEAKEGVQVQAESQTLATITLQNFFRLYHKLAGMTGTAETESQEFFSTYKLQVLVIPTNRPVVRNDHNDVIYRTRREKYDAIIDEALEMHEQGRPVLIGTISVDVSQHLSNLFTARGIPLANWLKKGDVTKELESGRFHTVLNAKHHKSEAEIVAKAGLPGAITIATNMAGRGTDIKLTPAVVQAGGLHIIGSEKHEARRIDRQLRGRAGRQGDPGSSRFYLSLEDDLMRLFGSDRITSIMSSMGSMDEGERIEHSLITKSIERAQKKVEERNFEIRKQLLEYDDVLNEQRKIIYKRRQNLLGFAKAEDYVESKLKKFIQDDNDRSAWNLVGLLDDIKKYFGAVPADDIDELERMKYSELEAMLRDWVADQIERNHHFNQLQERHRIFGYADVNQVLKQLIKLKIRLHNAGTTDVSRWNIDGIKFELERIFNQSPEWLTPGASTDAAALENKIVAWAQEIYQQKIDRAKYAFNDIILSHIPIKDFVSTFIFGLMNLHMPQDQAPINWRTDAFLADLDRILGAHPDIGANEIKSIRLSKLVDICNEWLDTLVLPADISMRHRILGYFGAIRFVEAVIARRLFEHDATAAKELAADDADYFKQIFAQTFSVSTDDNAEAMIVQLIRQARQFYRAKVRDQQDAYDDVMLASALNEELLEAAIHAVVEEILAAQTDQAAAQKELSRRLDNMFLAKPELTVPSTRDANSVAVFTEDVVAWGLAFYKKYSDRVERIQQEELSSEIVSDSVVGMIDDTIYAMIAKVLDGDDILDSLQARRLESECRLIFRQAPRVSDGSSEGMDPNMVMDEIGGWAKNLYYKRVRELGRDLVTRLERYYVLEKIDENWRQHLHGVDELREGIGLRGYGQKDPLLEYKREAFAMFERTIDSINRETVSTLFKVFDVGGEMEDQQMRRIEPQSFTTSHSQVEVFNQAMKQPAPAQQQRQPRPGEPPRQKTVVNTKTVGRNDPCPCGSGKKYKNCCGKI